MFHVCMRVYVNKQDKEQEWMEKKGEAGIFR